MKNFNNLANYRIKNQKMDRVELLKQVTGILSSSESPMITKDILKHVEGDFKKSDINSILYAALNCGLVDKIELEEDGKKLAPQWKLTFESLRLGKVPLEEESE